VLAGALCVLDDAAESVGLAAGVSVPVDVPEVPTPAVSSVLGLGALVPLVPCAPVVSGLVPVGALDGGVEGSGDGLVIGVGAGWSDLGAGAG
jgi:hypothetical protein